jgi:hypothetical protein
MEEEIDWRLRQSHEDIRGSPFVRKNYVAYSDSWDHDHCEFCFSKFSASELDALRSGYATADNYYWVCDECFKDFATMFGLTPPR